MENKDIIEALNWKLAVDRVLRGHQQADPKQAAFEAAAEQVIALLSTSAQAEDTTE
jgi:hypothetical protein